MTNLFGTFRNAARKRRQYLEVLSELQELNERQLNDIGVQRRNMRRFARDAVYKS